jgi:hypothetical protein
MTCGKWRWTFMDARIWQEKSLLSSLLRVTDPPLSTLCAGNIAERIQTHGRVTSCKSTNTPHWCPS